MVSVASTLSEGMALSVLTVLTAAPYLVAWVGGMRGGWARAFARGYALALPVMAAFLVVVPMVAFVSGMSLWSTASTRLGSAAQGAASVIVWVGAPILSIAISQRHFGAGLFWMAVINIWIARVMRRRPNEEMALQRWRAFRMLGTVVGVLIPLAWWAWAIHRQYAHQL